MGNNLSGKINSILASVKSKFRGFFQNDISMFLLQFIRHPNDIGTFFPSTAILAEAITRHVVPDGAERKGKRYLEAGAGTGAFTKIILQKLTAADQLDLVEINPAFCDRLKDKYSHLPNVSVYEGSVLDWNPDKKYDAIVSSLPLNAFSASFVEEILKHYQCIAKPGGYVSYCEFWGLPKIRKMLLLPKAKKRLQDTLDAKRRFEEKFEVSVEKLYINLPPAVVHHCRFPG